MRIEKIKQLYWNRELKRDSAGQTDFVSFLTWLSKCKLCLWLAFLQFMFQYFFQIEDWDRLELQLLHIIKTKIASENYHTISVESEVKVN